MAGAILHAEPRHFGGRPRPGKLDSFIRKLLEKDPAKRYASAEEAHTDLKALRRRASRKRCALETAMPEIARLVAAEEFANVIPSDAKDLLRGLQPKAGSR